MSKYYKAEDVLAIFSEEERPLNWTDSESEIQAQNDFDCYKGMIESLPTIEVSEDAISREGLLNTINAYMTGSQQVEHMKSIIKNAPSVVPKTQIKTQNSNENSNEGEWINKQEKYQMAECSNCKKVTMHEMWGDKLVYYDYCPNCGAKMKGVDNENYV